MITDHDQIPRELQLNAATDGKITAVTLYPYQADVTRTFQCQLDSGSTQIKISTGFPSSFDETRLKICITESVVGVVLGDVKTVWGKGTADPNYDNIDALYAKKSLLQKSLARRKLMTTALDTYAQKALDKEYRMSPLDVGRFMDSYEAAGAKWDAKVDSLEKEIREIEDRIYEEEESDGASNSPDGPKYSRTGITFTLTTEAPRSVDFSITYGVTGASWYADYDVLAASDNDHTVTFVYKAIITNNTGESWTDTDLKLGSTAPQATPKLQPWKLSFQKLPNNDPNAMAAYPTPKILTSAEILLPEKVNLLERTQAHAIVIGRYTLGAKFSRLCTPRVSGSVRLQATVTNTSSYPLRSGNSGVYLDNNFVSSIYLPSSNPGESFDLVLGTDPNILITYHPCTKDTTAIDVPSPLAYRPVTAYSCTQCITVTNTRDIPVSSLTIVDSIPTSDDIDIFIKLINPPLKYPEAVAPGLRDLGQARTGIPVTEGVPKSCNVTARWDFVDEPLHDLSLLGVNGKMNWVCSIEKKESVDLNLQWQVLVYSSKQIKDF